MTILIHQSNIDSLDIVVIRVALEKYFGFDVSDVIWYKFQTLAESLEYFHNHQSKHIKQETKEQIIDKEKIEIRMPQMANFTLSENWLLKHLGDKHWHLLSKGFNLKSSEFKDNENNRLYATFIRIKYSLSRLDNFKENDTIDFNSTINAFGNNTFLSNIVGKTSKGELNAELLTTFSIRIDNDSNEINKGEFNGFENSILQLQKTPQILSDYRLLKKELVEYISTNYGDFPNTDNIIFTYEYEINPYYDINGVGLLYFASFPIISDWCLLKFLKQSNISDSKQTIYRDIYYFSNCSANDKIIFELNHFEETENMQKILVTLRRKSDKKIIAKIITLKK